MTRSVYVVGGAGTGKSTFTGQVLDLITYQAGPLEDLAQKPNARGVVITMRGHRLHTYDGDEGMYVGVMRDHFPGTDGLDRASSIAGEVWLENGPLPDFIIGEGATLANRRFIGALRQHTDLLLVHLMADDFVKELRFQQRGSNQQDSFVTATATRSANLFNEVAEQGGATLLEIDTADTRQWALAIEEVVDHLRGR